MSKAIWAQLRGRPQKGAEKLKSFISGTAWECEQTSEAAPWLAPWSWVYFSLSTSVPPRKDSEIWECSRTTHWLLFVSMFWGQGKEHYPKETLHFIHREP